MKWFQLLRFIPVDTGNTSTIANSELVTAVHPRGYGEHLVIVVYVHCFTGSSPWIRGTPRYRRICSLFHRFIPVDTGNTPSWLMITTTAAVHPRGYGEHVFQFVFLHTSSGSSPWIRGTQSKNGSLTPFQRFIPVDTGNTLQMIRVRLMTPVHPRGYGEHINKRRRSSHKNGSSPWIRGTLFNKRKIMHGMRFIPVDTGNTPFLAIEHLHHAVHPRGYGEHLA